MTQNDRSSTASPDAIERDIEATQTSISDTVEQLQKRLNPRSLIDAVLGDENDAPQQLLQAAKDNPVAVGLVGLGALLLVSGKAPSLPSFTRKSDQSHDDGSNNQRTGHSRWGWSVDHHSSFVEHMGRVQPREGEDDLAFQRRRDMARGDYLMIDRDHDEDDASFRGRLNQAQQQLRDKTAAFATKARRLSHDGGDALSQGSHSAGSRLSSAYGSARERGGKAYQAASSAYSENPAIGGLVAAVLGAVVGAAIPPSELERQKLGGIGSKTMAVVAEQKDRAIAKAHAMIDGQPAPDGDSDAGQTGTAPENFVGGLSPQAGFQA